jgi:hypothetical protein
MARRKRSRKTEFSRNDIQLKLIRRCLSRASDLSRQLKKTIRPLLIRSQGLTLIDGRERMRPSKERLL